MYISNKTEHFSFKSGCDIGMLRCLKGQCAGIKAMQSRVISQPVKSLLNIVLQEFVEFIINKGRKIAQSET